jgi:NCS1 family nucleobase:cation symporter-1
VKLPQWVTVIIGGVIGMFIALVFGGDQFQSNFLLFLHVVSYYITPWVAVLLVDYFVVQRAGRNSLSFENFYTPAGAFGRINVAGIGAMLAGVVISIPFMANDFYTGPIGSSLDGADVSYFVSGIAAAVIYLVARRRFAPRNPHSSTVQ